MKRAIEETFPIVEINRLAVPERNAFKPIYMMHKWFARRASCVFRAILLASMKPAGTNIMEEFYKDHTDDTDTNGVKILDPFMGGGTTVIEALRLGSHVTGIDLNPVAWFIVKSEAESVDIDKLKDAFERLANRKTASSRSVKDELLSHYKTECPCCGSEADTIYTFWIKSAICTNPTCKKEVSLFKDYIIALKSPSIRYISNYVCPHCSKTFDLDIELASMIAEKHLMMENPKDSAGQKRGNVRWTYVDRHTGESECPWCHKSFKPKEAKDKNIKKEKKKVPLTVLLCPHCYSVWQTRGGVCENPTCPVCHKGYGLTEGNIVGNGKFLCSSCGAKDAVITSVRKLPEDQLLPSKPYGLEGYCPNCAGENHNSTDLLGQAIKRDDLDHSCTIYKNNGRFFKKLSPQDLKRYDEAEKRWNNEKDSLPYPTSLIPDGQETHRLLEHHYKYWYQMFNPRQLLCLGILLDAIDKEDDQALKEMLLTAFFNTLNNVGDFCSYRHGVRALRQVFARHDFAPKLTPCENNVWGSTFGMGNFSTWVDAVVSGKSFHTSAWDYIKQDNKSDKIYSDNLKGDFVVVCQSSVDFRANFDCQLIVTDPPYAGNVNYSELADYFYVWLKLILAKEYPCFSTELTPKAEEIVENEARGKSSKDYEEGLAKVWRRCYDLLHQDGILAFTFHHAESSAWEALLESLCDSGFVIEAIYPIHSESESSLHLMDKQAISYDLIHVCKKRVEENNRRRSWAGIRQEIRRMAREEIKLIESGRYGEGQLLEADINIVLTGKCLELYSKYYGNIVDYKNEAVPLSRALSSIRMIVEQLVNQQNPLPSDLVNIDPVSYVYLTCLCDRKEIKSDEVHKATRGILEPDALFKAGVIIKWRGKRGRSYYVKLPDERIKDLEKTFGKRDKYAGGQAFLFPEMEQEWFDNIPLVDIIHYLMALAIVGENIAPWLNTFKTVLVPVRVALEYLMQRNPTFQEPIKKIMNLIEV